MLNQYFQELVAQKKYQITLKKIPNNVEICQVKNNVKPDPKR